MHEILRTEHPRLRRFEPADLDNLVNLYSDHQVMRYIDAETWNRDWIASEVLPVLLAEYGVSVPFRENSW